MTTHTSRKITRRSVESVCTLAIAFFSLTGSIKAQATPTLASAVNGKIAFARFENGGPWNGQIYLINPDGSNSTQLTSNPEGLGSDSPVWSPDGTRIAFASWGRNPFLHKDIYVMEADGSNRIALTKNPDGSYDNYRYPAWSPDGSRIAFTSFRVGRGYSRGDSQWQIYVIKADGSNPIRITNSSTESSYGATWSPDGARIAFTRFGSGLSSEVYVMDADGSHQTQLTNNPGETNEFPAWSPDGTKIAFDSNRTGAANIYVMNADGSNQTRLTNSPNSGRGPEWSPDGTKIAFTGTNIIVIMDADGSNQVYLTAGGGPRWQRLPGPRSSSDGIR